MLRFATVQCYNPACKAVFEAAIENDYHAECPQCGQVARVAGRSMSKELSGRCEACARPLDELHIYGRLGYCCPPLKP